jgi:hypothetical protein
MVDVATTRYWARTVLSVFAAVLAIITPFWPDWIEALSGWDPDAHDGTAEKYIAAGLLVVAVALLAMAPRRTAALENSVGEIGDPWRALRSARDGRGYYQCALSSGSAFTTELEFKIK